MKTHCRFISKSISKSKRSISVLPLAALSLSAAMSVTLLGCGDAANGGAFSSTLASVDVDQGAGFSVTPTFTNAITSNTHIFGAFGSPCTIAKAQTHTSQKCMVNVRETDNFANEMRIGLNVPAGMCKYLEKIPYYYYNWRPGQGPTSYTVHTTNGTLDGCTVGGVAGSISNGVCLGVGAGTIAGRNGMVSTTGTATCGYDYSKQSPAGPNCCIGSYTTVITTHVTTGTPPPADTVATNVGTYDGTPGACAAGPGVSKLWPVHVQVGAYKGFPGAVLIKVPDNGYAEVIENRIPQIYVSGLSDTISNGNFYFNWNSYLSLGNSVANALPPAIDPSSLIDGGGFIPTSPGWEFLCEDESREILHRISLYVNEWDTNEQFSTYLASNGTAGKPGYARNDQEGIDCAVGGSINYGLCNDFYSLRDYNQTYGIGSFPMDTINDSATASTN